MGKYRVTIKNNDTEDNYEVSVYNDKEQQVLTYKENDKTSTSFDYKNNILRRDNDKMTIEFPFALEKTTKGKMSVKELEGNLEMDILTKELEVKEDYIKVVYEINDLSFEYTLEKE